MRLPLHQTAAVFMSSILLIGSGYVCGCGEEPSETDAAGDEHALPVEVAHPVSGSREARSIQVAGTVEPLRRTPLAFQVGGRVAEVRVELGDLVQEQDVLAKLELRDLRIASREAKAAVKGAEAGLAAADEAGYQLAEKELTRVRQLAAAGGATQSLLDQAEAKQRAAWAKLLEARAGLQRARALRDRALAALADGVLEAPFHGIVVHKTLEKGQIIAPGVPVFVLEDLDRVRIVATIPAANLPEIDQQQAVSIQVSEASESAFQGRIRAFGWAGDPATGTFPVEVLVDNPEHRLRSGMVAWLELPRLPDPADKQILVVPLPAVTSRGDGPHVFVVESSSRSRARRLPVTLHGFERDQARVSGELGPNSLVVIQGQHNLDDGSVVRMIGTNAPGAGGS